MHHSPVFSRYWTFFYFYFIIFIAEENGKLGINCICTCLGYLKHFLLFKTLSTLHVISYLRPLRCLSWLKVVWHQNDKSFKFFFSSDVDQQARVRRRRSLDRPQKVLLKWPFSLLDSYGGYSRIPNIFHQHVHISI